MNKLSLVWLIALIAVATFACSSQTTSTSQPSETSQAQNTTALRQTQSIPLPSVEGRIDHMAIDLQGGRLFVAALGNNTVEVIDLKTSKRTDEIQGLEEPQGVAYVPEDNKLLVSNGNGDSLDIYDGQSFKLLNQVVLGDDPDNIRYDLSTGYAYVGYGTGSESALGVVDVSTGTKVADIKLSGHPESFQLEENGQRIFVNVPTTSHIAVVDRDKGTVVETWPQSDATENFPMALDEANHRLFVGTRSPAKLVVLDTETGKSITSLDASGDADDIFYDANNKCIYVSGGEGAISVFEQTDPDTYRLLGKVDTAEGARTSLFVADSGVLYVAVPHRGSQQAEVRAFQTGLPNLLLQLAAVNNSEVAIAVLENDLNNSSVDYDSDSIIEPLAGLGLVLVVLSTALVLRAVGDSRPLLSVCEPPILCSVWLLGLERPG